MNLLPFTFLRRIAALCLGLFTLGSLARADDIVSFLESRNGNLNLGTYEYWFDVSSPQTLRFRLEALSGTSNITINRRLPNGGVDELLYFARFGGSYGPLGDKGYREFALQAGSHTIRLNSSITSGWIRMSEITLGNPGPANQAPSITWQEAPGAVTTGDSYRVSARAHDPDGNLTQVNVWKNGQPFAFADGGNGTDGDSGNPTSDAGPGSVTFTAQAVDADGATSPTITHVVTINAPANRAPSVTLDSPGSQTVTVGTTLTLASRAADPDGNLSNHNFDILRPAGDWNFQGAFAAGEPFQGGPMGSGADSTRTAGFTFSEVGNYTVRAAASDGSGWVHSGSVTITVVPAAVPNRAPSIEWLSRPSSVGHQQGYTVSARAQDADGNLTQVNVWKNGVPFAFAGGGNGSSGDSGNPTADTGPQTISFTAQAVDSAGAVSAVINHTVTIDAPLPVQFTLVTAAGSGGSVSPGGSYTQGTTATVTAVPDAIHDFSGWTGDAGGTSNPLSLLMDRNRSVQALFALKSFALITSATSGGAVTAGGTYPYGTTVTVTASPSANARFMGWAGDATGSAQTIAVTMTGPRNVQAVFAQKTAQSISFSVLGDVSAATGLVTLSATASSGLPVSFTVLSGPAALDGNRLQFSSPGTITVEARQEGNEFFLPASPVTRTLNVAAPAVLKYRAPSRTLLQSEHTRGSVPFVLEQP